MSKTATLLLAHTPTEERLTEIVEEVVANYGPSYGHVTWLITDEIPPAGYGVDVIDQLEAHHRDTPGSVFLTVVMDNTRP